MKKKNYIEKKKKIGNYFQLEYDMITIFEEYPQIKNKE